MRRVFVSFLLATLVCPVSRGQSQPSFDSVYSSVIARYGPAVAQAANAKLDGTITYPQTAASPFTLTLQNRQLRFDLSSAEGLSVVRDADLAQATRAGTKRHFADRSPLYISGMNLGPVLTLLYFYNNPAYLRSLVPGTGGTNILRFTETLPAGSVEPPLFRQPKLVVSFLVAGSNEIQSISYEDTPQTFLPVVYTYLYVDSVTTPFLQPKNLVCQSGSQVVYSAQVTSAQLNVTVPANFFRIVR
jgi:hypothetical protein